MFFIKFFLVFEIISFGDRVDIFVGERVLIFVLVSFEVFFES